MFRMNRCNERPMNYSQESSYKYSNTNMNQSMNPYMNPNMNQSMNQNEYPQAMPAGMMDMGGMGMMGCQMPPVYECPEERVCHKEFVHEVPHICPINTRIINHHIYRHTYTPCYTCCEENEVCNVYDGCCNKF